MLAVLLYNLEQGLRSKGASPNHLFQDNVIVRLGGGGGGGGGGGVRAVTLLSVNMHNI